MKIVCGLGNPGRDHAAHRHNIGFQVVDRLAEAVHLPLAQEKFEARVGLGTFAGERVLLIEPQTWMNLSGHAVAPAVRFYKVPMEGLLVVHDELDLPFGRLQLKAGGGSGGHNGLNSLLESLGDDGFVRLRVGVGKPAGPEARARVLGHVLSAFAEEERAGLGALLDRCVEACTLWLREGLGPAMNQVNRRP